MKTFAAILGAVVLAAGSALAASTGNADYDMPSAPVATENPVQVDAAQVLSSTEMTRAGVKAGSKIMVSDFTAPGERSTYTR